MPFPQQRGAFLPPANANSLRLRALRITFRGVRKSIPVWLVFLLGTWLAAAEPLQVCALHPLMADLARQVGGDRVRVFDLVGEGGNLHRFEPRPADMSRMRESALVLAGGKNLEPYLGRLRDTLGGVTILEVGRTIPSLTVGEEEHHADSHEHAAGSLDPHWWHGVSNMSRAARVVAQALAEKDPAGKEIFQANASAYGKRLEELKRWANSELAKVPPGQRKLVTAHNAFAYFAREFGFEVIAVAGLNQEQGTAPQDLSETIESVRKAGVKAVFPELNASSRTLESISKATGAKIGTPLIADGNGTGTGAGFEGMIRHNVTAITEALAAP
jgi:zinc/manganese transport system substrate-binding protein